MIRKIFIIFSVVLLIYMLWPGPGKISDFKPLPNSVKSSLDGDIWQVPHVAAYFSNNFRDVVIPFYLKNYQESSHFPFPPLVINYPPEYSWTAIKKHTDSTYLEEFAYPLRNSVYVNGLEMFHPDGTPVFWGAPKLPQDGKFWLTKTTLRFYRTGISVRFMVWLGIVFSIFLLFKMGRSVLKE